MSYHRLPTLPVSRSGESGPRARLWGSDLASVNEDPSFKCHFPVNSLIFL